MSKKSQSNENAEIIRILKLLIKISKKDKMVLLRYIIILEYFKKMYETDIRKDETLRIVIKIKEIKNEL